MWDAEYYQTGTSVFVMRRFVNYARFMWVSWLGRLMCFINHMPGNICGMNCSARRALFLRDAALSSFSPSLASNWTS